MTNEHIEGMIARRMKNTGESREVAVEHIMKFFQGVASGQLQLVDQPDGSAVILETRN